MSGLRRSKLGRKIEDCLSCALSSLLRYYLVPSCTSFHCDSLSSRHVPPPVPDKSAFSECDPLLKIMRFPRFSSVCAIMSDSAQPVSRAVSANSDELQTN